MSIVKILPVNDPTERLGYLRPQVLKVLEYPPIHDRDNNLMDTHTLAIM